jgi:hypothetical protein
LPLAHHLFNAFGSRPRFLGIIFFHY